MEFEIRPLDLSLSQNIQKIIDRQKANDKFMQEVLNHSKYFNVVNIVEPTEDGQKRIDDLKSLKFGQRLDRTQPHWAFLNEK